MGEQRQAAVLRNMSGRIDELEDQIALMQPVIEALRTYFNDATGSLETHMGLVGAWERFAGLEAVAKQARESSNG